MEININTTRIIVNFFVTVFVIVVILTVLLLLLYYLTPNNYVIEVHDETKYTLSKEYTVNINPGTNIIIPESDVENNFLKFEHIENSNILSEKRNDTQILIKNVFKSQSVIINNDDIIKILFGSKIIIPNQTEKSIDVKISIYKNKM